MEHYRSLAIRYAQGGEDDAVAELENPDAERIAQFLRSYRAALARPRDLALFLCTTVATDTEEMRHFVMHGPFQTDILFNANMYDVATRVLAAAPQPEYLPMVHELLAHVATRREWFPDDWKLVVRGMLDAPRKYTGTPLAQAVLRRWLKDAVPEAVPVLRLVHTAGLDSVPLFRLGRGVDLMMQAALSSDQREHAGSSLTDAYHSPESVVVAPLLVRFVQSHAAHITWAPLVQAAGTTLVVRLVREGRDVAALVRTLALDVQTALRELWPTRVDALLGRDVVADTVPKTAYACPITLCPCVDPVVASDGHTYERDAILSLLVRGGTSPFTRLPLEPFVVSNYALMHMAPPVENECGDAGVGV